MISAAAAAALPLRLQAAGAPAPARGAVLRLSCQEGVAPGKSLGEKLDFLEANGFEGLEVGGKGLPGRVGQIRKALDGRKIRVSAVCAGFQGVLISEDPASRQLADTSIREILAAAGELGATGMIMVPAFHNQTKLGHEEARDLLVKSLHDLGGYAAKNGSCLLLEPLNRRECHFLRQVSDAAAICRDADSPGIGVMGDFWHMTWEETSDFAAFAAAGPYLRHVHIASRKERKIPGEDPGDNYVEGFKGLKWIGYKHFVSLECGCRGDRRQALTAAVRLMRGQWAQA